MQEVLDAMFEKKVSESSLFPTLTHAQRWTLIWLLVLFAEEVTDSFSDIMVCNLMNIQGWDFNLL